MSTNHEKEARAREEQARIALARTDPEHRCGVTKWVGKREMVCVRPPHNTQRTGHKHCFV